MVMDAEAEVNPANHPNGPGPEHPNGASQQLNVSPTENPRGFAIEGELDLATAPELGRILLPAVACPGDMVLDLAGLTFMDSSGLRLLLQAAKASRGDGPIVIAHSTGAVRRVLELALPNGVPGLEILA